MPNIKTILAPVDFSDRAVHALEHADALAKLFGARIIVAHFVPPSPYEYAAFDEGFFAAATWPEMEEVREKLEKRLDEVIVKARVKAETEKIVQRGDAVNEIVALVEDRGVDLVILPTHGYGPFRRFVLGSVTNKVLHDVEIPVFTGTHVPEIAPIDPEPYKRIACAIDLSDQSEEVLRWAHEMAEATANDLIVIHAAPRLEVGGAYGDWFPPETREQIVANARQAVDKMLAKLGIKAEVHVDSAEPVSYIRDVADRSYADLLIIGRAPKGGLLSGLREHAYAIVREAPCPVISV
jgi:nucleotide-binding universal stress UspA family protein